MSEYKAHQGVCGMIDVIGPEGGVCVCASMFVATELVRKLNHYEILMKEMTDKQRPSTEKPHG